MISVKLMGGLGNQMFQYAFAKNLSLICNVELELDLSFLNRRDLGKNFTYRNYDLDIFNIQELTTIKEKNYNIIKEPHFHFSIDLYNYVKNLLKSGKNISLDGYWQSSKYFKESEEEVRKLFEFTNKITDDISCLELIKKIKNSNSVMVNIRRTDYLNNDFHGVVSSEYVNSAKKIIKAKVDNPKYFIFSDDIKWCQDNLTDDSSEIITHEFSGFKFSKYLQLMTLCNHFIIPNSTFAWWAAYLNDDENKCVIAPKKWFNRENIKTSDVYLKNWNLI